MIGAVAVQTDGGNSVKELHSTWWISLLILFGVLLGPVTPAFGEVIGPVVSGFAMDGAIKEWTKRPPTLSLIPRGAGARTGKIWLAQAPQGLVIAGRVEGPPPVFAKSAENMPNGDHVEVWIALVEDVPLPPIGWSDKFGDHQLRDLADCDGVDVGLGEHCRAWFAEQVGYRRQFPRLFARQWQLAPGVAVETYAKPAFDAMTESRKRLEQTVPQGWFEQLIDEVFQIELPEARFGKTYPEGYSFEVLVPWKALPPANRLTLDRMRLLVDVFSPGKTGRYGAFSTSSKARQYGKVNTMNRLVLTPPHRWRLARCSYPLETFAASPKVWGNYHSPRLPAYFLPAENERIDQLFVLGNQYIDFHTAPAGLSPIIKPNALFSLHLAPGMVACGPKLAVRRGETLTLAEGLQIRPEPDARAKEVPGGWLLASGPYEEMASMAGEGYCGACEEIALDMIFIPTGQNPPMSAFHAGGLICGCCSGADCIEEITLADDFKTIRVIKNIGETAETATMAEFCFDAAKHVYVPCHPKTR
jgi:hypothetical protein